jgi:hypothetical protein
MKRTQSFDPRRGMVRTDFGEYTFHFTADERAKIKAGSEALRLLQDSRTRSWHLWVAVGDALLLVRDKVMKVTEAPAPIGKTYNGVFSELLSRFGLVIEGATRTRLLDLMGHRREVESWREDFPDQAMKLTHPNSVWRAYHAWKESQPPAKKQPEKIIPLRTLWSITFETSGPWRVSHGPSYAVLRKAARRSAPPKTEPT